MKRPVFAIALLLAFWSIGSSQKPATSETAKKLFLGSWKADLERSQRDPNHQFSSLVIKFEFAEDTVLLTYSGVNMAGKPEGATRKFFPDGKVRSITEAPAYTQTDTWRGSRVLESVSLKDGKTVGQSTYEISGDGTTLTAKVKGIDASGRHFEQVIVFVREKASPK